MTHEPGAGGGVGRGRGRAGEGRDSKLERSRTGMGGEESQINRTIIPGVVDFGGDVLWRISVVVGESAGAVPTWWVWRRSLADVM